MTDADSTEYLKRKILDEQEKELSNTGAKSGMPVIRTGRQTTREPVPVYKYSNRLRGDINESIILSGMPVFVNYVNDKIGIVNLIPEKSRTLRPVAEEEYPYEPYRFKDAAEIKDYIERALNETPDSLFTRIGSTVSYYNDQQQYKLNIVAADIYWSYFQDRFSTTHYDLLTGGNGSGKSSLGNTFGAMAYLAVNMTDPTAANLYRLLGPIEPGQCTMILEESEKIDQSQDLMSILKTGYDLNGRVPRINMNTGNQEFFFSFGIKLIIAERSPNQNIAKGVLDRTFSIKCFKGNPKRDIKEALNPTNTGGSEHQKWLEETYDLRKLLFIKRILHFKDPIPDVDIGVIGRDKELAKPLLQLFHGTNAQNEIAVMLQKFLDIKNKRKAMRLDSVLLPIVVDLISEHGYSFLHSIFWDKFKNTIPGHQDVNKPNEYHTQDYGTVYRTTITSNLQDFLGAEPSHSRDGNILTFDKDLILAARKKYTNIITVNGEGVKTMNTVGRKEQDRPTLEEGLDDIDNRPQGIEGIAPDAFTAFTLWHASKLAFCRNKLSFYAM